MSIVEEVACLRRIPLFANIDVAKLKLLAFTSERVTFKAGEELFHQGDPGTCAYLLLEGEAEVAIDTEDGVFPVAVLGRSEIVGEIAILCDVPRTATVRARSDLTTLCISKDLFFRLIGEFPQMAVQIMRVLAHRLDQTLRTLSRHSG